MNDSGISASGYMSEKYFRPLNMHSPKSFRFTLEIPHSPLRFDWQSQINLTMPQLFER
jgi:hypothetical protein